MLYELMNFEIISTHLFGYIEKERKIKKDYQNKDVNSP